MWFIKFTGQIGGVGVDSAVGDQVGLCGTVAFCENLKRTVVSHHLQLPLACTTGTVSGTARLEKILYVHLFTYFAAWRLTRFIFCFSPECLFANNVLVTSLISCITPGVNIYEANKCILLKSPTSTCPPLTAFFQKLYFSSNARMIPADRW